MSKQEIGAAQISIFNLDDLAKVSDYSLMDNLNPDPEATSDGMDHFPRQVFSGHYVPVKPTQLQMQFMSAIAMDSLKS